MSVGRGVSPKLGAPAGRGGRGRGRGEIQQQRSPGVTRRRSGEPLAEEPPSTIVHLSSLTSGITADELTLYFEAVVPDATVSSPVILGEGKATLVLKGLTSESLQQLRTRKHRIRGKLVTIEFKSSSKAVQEPPPHELDEEKGLNKIIVSNVPDVSEEVLKTFFEGSKGGGCAGAVADIAKISSGEFHVTFHDPKVAAQVVCETRIFKKATLQLTLVKEFIEPEQSDAGDPCQIEVSNVPETVTEELLKTYFEGAKSGSCANAVAECRNIGPGVFIVTFHDPKVAARVMDKESHKFKKADLQLRFVHHKVQEYKPNQLAIHGLPEGVGKGVMEVAIAGCLDMDEEDDFELEVSGQSATITFVKDYSIEDLQQMMSAITSEPLKGAKVTVELCKDTKPSIHIRNISPEKCDEEFLELYFSNAKKSGGGEVESIKIINDNEAIVTFSDCAVIQSVLKRQHPMLGEAKLCEATSPLAESSVCSIPSMKPLEVPVDPLLVQSLSRSPSGLEQSILGSNVTFSADEKAGLVVFSPTRQSKSSWQEDCQEQMATYVKSSLIKEEINVPKEAAEQAMSAVMKLQKENSSLVVTSSSEGTVIAVAGELSTVSKAKELIEDICSTLIIGTASIVLSPEDYDYVQQMKKSELPATIECTFDPHTFKIFLKGPVRDVTKFQECIESFIQHVDIPVMLEPLVTEFFRTETGKGKLESFLQERQCQAALYFNPHPHLTLHLLCKSENANSVRAVMAAIPLAVTAQVIPVPAAVAPALPNLEEFSQLCQRVEKEHAVLIKHMGHEISAAGFKVEVSSSLAEINRFLQEKATPLPPAELRVGTLIAKALNNSSRGFEKHLQSYPVYVQINPSEGVVQFSPKHYLNPGWEESCKSRASEYICANIADKKVQVPPNAYKDIMDVLYSSKLDDSSFVHDYPPQGTSLAFAGDKNTVKSTEEKIARICASHSYTSVEMHLDPEDFEFLHHFKMEDLISKYHPSVDIDPQPETHTLLLSGTVKGVESVKEYVPSLTDHATVPVVLEEAVVKYLATEKGKEKLYGFLREKRCNKCAAYISESPMKLLLLCAPKHKRTTEAGAKDLKESMHSVSLQIPDLVLPFLSELPDFVKEVKSLEERNSVQISIEDKHLLVAGFKGGVSTSTENLSAFVRDKTFHFQPVHVPIDPLIAKCIESNPVPFHACMANIQVKCTIKAEKSTGLVSLLPTKATKSGWKEECQAALTSYIETNYSKEEIEVPKLVAADIFPDLIAKSKQNVIQFEWKDGSRAIVAGERSVVQAVQTKVINMCHKYQTTEIIQLNDREYDFFFQVVQPRLKSAVTFEGTPAKNTIVIGGSIHDVTDMKNAMKGMVRHSRVPVIVESVLAEFFATNGKQGLASYVQKKGFHVALHSKPSVYPPSLEFLCDPNLEESVRDLARVLPEEMKVRVIPLPKSLTIPPEAEGFNNHCCQLEKTFQVLIRTTQNEVKVCGFRDSVEKATPPLSAFIKKKCTIREAVPIQKGIWRLFSGPMKQTWMRIEAQCQNSEVEVVQPEEEGRKFTVFLNGDKVEVQKIRQSIVELIRSVAKRCIPLTRPGLCEYFSGEKGRMQIPGIEKHHKVCIEVVEVGEEMETELTATKSIAHGQAPMFVKEVLNRKQICIYIGDITVFRADAIVNAANETLSHVGGVADAILKKGGRVIQQDCDRYVRGHGPLKPGEVWMSDVVGNLPCCALIHAVGPRWHNNPSKQQLQDACMNCLKQARTYNSIALPAISSGIFGCPMDQCANILISTAVKFFRTQPSNLQEINFVLLKQADAVLFIKALQADLPSQNIRQRSDTSAHNSSIGDASYDTSFHEASSHMLRSASDEEEIEEELEEYEEEPLIQGFQSPLSRIQVQQGSILDVEAEIYVNSTNGNLDLSGGAVSQILAKAAGPSLQAECNKKAPINVGGIAVTKPGDIRRCRNILHINCPQYDRSGGQAETVLRSIIHTCMKECDKRGASTIVFPAIGTGNLGFPHEVAAHIMVDEVCNYLENNKCKSLSMVYFIIYMENMFRNFQDEVEKRKQQSGFATQPKMAPKAKKSKRGKPKRQQFRGRKEQVKYPVPQPQVTGQRTLFHKPPQAEPTTVTKQGDIFDLGNNINIQVLKGDITTEKTDAIVNTTNREMRLQTGGVAAALLKKAGEDLQKACDEKTAKGENLSEGKVINTRAGKLKCKQVFHIVFQSNNQETFAAIIASCIERAIQLKYTSIAFPAIGTGMQGLPANIAAKGMLNAMLQCHPPNVLSVRIVIFQDSVYGAFRAELNDMIKDQSTFLQKAGKAVKSTVTWLWSGSQPEKGDKEEKMDVDVEYTENEIELHIFGETKENVKGAEDSLNMLINMQFRTEDLQDEKVSQLNQSQEEALREEARRLQLGFSVDPALNNIQLKGSKENIAEMKIKIMEVFSEVEKEATRKAQADMVAKTVQWKRMDSSETLYDPETNLDIEEAYCRGEPSYDFSSSADNFSIDFKKMEEVDHGMGGKVYKVKRILEGAEAASSLPQDWEPMTDPASGKEVPLRVIDLPTTSDGYKFALAEFERTMTQGTNYTAIVTIQRIQNPGLYGQYAAKKKYLDTHNPGGCQNERWLFHGTKESSVPQINKTNFNRSFRGQNGTAYGQGVYFARDASYSNGYSSPGAQGLKHMYVARVLTGQYTGGSSSMLVAPAKDPNDPAMLYESVVNNTSNPSIFVVFYDADAYPEYLITYK